VTLRFETADYARTGSILRIRASASSAPAIIGFPPLLATDTNLKWQVAIKLPTDPERLARFLCEAEDLAL